PSCVGGPAKRLDAVEQAVGIFRRRRHLAGQRGVEIGVGHVHQMLELRQFLFREICNLGIGKAAENQVHLAGAAMPAAKQQPLAAVVEAIARSRRSRHFSIPIRTQKARTLPGGVDIATVPVNVSPAIVQLSTVCRCAGSAAGLRRHPSYRHCEERLRRSNPFSLTRKDGLLRRFRLRSLSYRGRVAPRNDVSTHESTISRHAMPEFCLNFPPSPNRGRRECRAPDAPRGLVCNVVVRRTRAYRSHRNHPAFPTQWFYGLWRALPGAPAFWPPSPALLFADLTPASGCQDHTHFPSASGAVVYDTIRVHRIPPHVSDVGQRPSSGTGRGEYSGDLHFRKTEYFSEGTEQPKSR